VKSGISSVRNEQDDGQAKQKAVASTTRLTVTQSLGKAEDACNLIWGV